MKEIILFLIILISIDMSSQNRERVFIDEFYTLDNWMVKNTETKTLEIDESNLILKHKVVGSSMIQQRDVIINPKYDYILEMSFIFKKIDKDQSSLGIVWAMKNKKNYYEFVIRADGKLSIQGKINGKKKKIKKWSTSESINKKKENILKIEQKGDKLSFYINNEIFHSIVKDISLDGNVAIKISGKTKVEVDYFNISYYDEPIDISLVEDPINGYVLKKLGDNINTIYSELNPYISSDGLRLFWTKHYNPENINPNAQDIWYSDFNTKTNKWEKSKNMGPPFNNKSSNSLISVSPDNNMYILKHRYLGTEYCSNGSISVSYNRNGNWTYPESQTIWNFRNDDNSSNFFLSNNGTELLMSIDNGESYGGLDIYVSSRISDTSWSKPLNLGSQLNTDGDDFGMFLASDNKTLFFSSEGHIGYGSSDIFMSKRLDDTWQNWSKPQNLGPEVNSSSWDAYFTLDAEGDYAYTVRDGDIYKIKLAESVKPEPIITLTGNVINTETNNIIDAVISHVDLNTNKILSISQSSTSNPYKFIFPTNNKCVLKIETNGFLSILRSVDLSNLKAFSDTTIDFYVAPASNLDSISNIYFDIGKFSLKRSEKKKLIEILGILEDYTEYNFEILGHTDNTPFHLSNQHLSDKRAEKVYNFMIKNGFPSERLSYIGYGEERPVYSNTNRLGRQKNRRVEIIFLR